MRSSDVSELTRSATDRSRPASRDAGDEAGSSGGVLADPVVGGDLQEESLPHRPNCCSQCGDELWSPSVLSIRAIGCQVGGVNHAIGAPVGTCWTTLDHGVEDLAAADDGEIRGLRLLVVGMAMPLPELAAAVALCRRLGRATGAIGVIVGRAERMEAACGMRWVRGVEQDITERGLRLDACGLADWVCEHLRAPPEDIDAGSFEGVGGCSQLGTPTSTSRTSTRACRRWVCRECWTRSRLMLASRCRRGWRGCLCAVA